MESKQRLGRPELEKEIGDILECFGTQMKDICDEQPYLMMLVAKSRKARNEALTKLLALYPDEKEIREQERERIINWLEEHRSQDLAVGYHRITFTQEEWQALQSNQQ